MPSHAGQVSLTLGDMALDPDDPRPPYQQVANALRAAILTRKLAPGEKLPSGSELASRYGVARMTIQQAIRVLRTLYPCANAECHTDLIMHTAPSASITDARLAAFRTQYMLTPAQLHDYATGSHDSDGVWRQASLFS